ncbi:MAG: lipopolysaccharide biosynthesis protein [Candidatus Omnitrophica bacterium]|nr:lipopolysaccharide biosynthesis protein [Candidatus Omnitrophota bacterium]
MENLSPRPLNDELTLRDYLRIIFRHKWIVVVSILTVSAVVAFALKMQTPAYVASVKMLVSAVKETQAPNSRDITARSEANVTQSEIVKSTPVLERAVRAVHLDKRPLDNEKSYASPLRRNKIESEVKKINERLNKMSAAQKEYVLFRRAVDTLQRNLTVEPIRGTNLLLVSVSDFDPLVAATLANVVSRSYVIFDLEQQLAESATKYGDLHPTVTLLKGHVDQMTKTLNGEPLNNIEAIGPATVKIISQASIPTRPEGRSKKIIFALAGFLSLILGIGLAFVFEYLDPTVRSPLDLGKLVQVPLLGVIPREFRRKKILDDDEKTSSVSYMSAYHELACQIRYFVNQKGLKVFLFTAPDVGEGNTSVVSNLGVCLANDFKKKVLIIDAHYHQAGVHKNFDNSVSPGLVDVLSGTIALSQACKEVVSNLWILAAGDKQVDHGSLLDSQRMADMIAEARKDFEIIFIDSADLRNYRDTVSMGHFADGIILVVSEAKTRRPAVVAALGPLQSNNFNIVGTVLNRRTFALPKFIYDRV